LIPCFRNTRETVASGPFLASSAHWLRKPKLRGDGFDAALHQAT
jgi:hypothetical protein